MEASVVSAVLKGTVSMDARVSGMVKVNASINSNGQRIDWDSATTLPSTPTNILPALSIDQTVQVSASGAGSLNVDQGTLVAVVQSIDIYLVTIDVETGNPSIKGFSVQDGLIEDAQVLTVSMSGASLFVGSGGKLTEDRTGVEHETDAVGFLVQNASVDLAFVIKSGVSFAGLEVSLDNATLLGVSTVDAKITGKARVNYTSASSGARIDWDSATKGAGTSERLYPELNIDKAVTLSASGSGSLDIDSGTLVAVVQGVTLNLATADVLTGNPLIGADGTIAGAEVFTVEIDQASLFVGQGGLLSQDRSSVETKPDAVGFLAEQASLKLAMVTKAGVSYLGLDVSAQNAKLLGLSLVDVQLTGHVFVNDTSLEDGKRIDWDSAVTTGISSGNLLPTLAIDKSDQIRVKASGSLDIGPGIVVAVVDELTLDMVTMNLVTGNDQLGDAGTISDAQVLSFRVNKANLYVGNGGKLNETRTQIQTEQGAVGFLVTDAAFALVNASKGGVSYTGLQVSNVTAALVGVQGLTIDATGSFKLNTSSADNGPLVDWTTASGIDNDPLNVMPDLAVTKSQLLSAIASARLTLAVGNDDVASLSADIRVEQRNVLGQKLYLLGAENVEAFLGLESEDLGIQLRYGIVAGVLTSSGFALQGSAEAEATGFDFILSGVVKVEVNQTGTAWNQLVPLPISETEKLVSFVDGQKFTRFELPTDFDIVLSANSVLTELLYDLAREVDSIYESLQTKQDSNGTPLAGSPLVSYLPGTTLSIDDLLPVKKLTLGGKNIAYYLDYMDYLSDPTGKQAPANPESLPTPDLDFNQDGINETAPTLRGLIAYLNKYWVKTFSNNATDELKLSLTPRGIAFRIALSTDENVQTELNIDTALEGFPLSFDAGAKFSLNAKTAIDIGFDLNWVNPAFRFDVNNLALFLKGNTNNLVAVGAFGPLAVNIGSQDGQKGVVSVDLGGAISVVDGRFTFTPASNSFDVLLPVYVTLAGVNLTSGTLPTVHVAGTIFGPNAGFTLEANHFENLLDFSNLTVIEIIQMFPDCGIWLEPSSPVGQCV
jgi:hypothetical protein